MRKFLKKILFPVLSRWYGSKTKKTSIYIKHGIRLTLLPDVFHPGLFFSTNLLIDYLKQQAIHDKRILELGAGSGMISFFAAKQQAIVTASDVNESALKGLHLNAENNQLPISIVASDLFASIDPNDFDFILINPPYYPKKPLNQQEMAFYCGKDFEYFQSLFTQLNEKWTNATVRIVMILSEDCNLEHIQSLGLKDGINFKLQHTVVKWAERNYIFELAKDVETPST